VIATPLVWFFLFGAAVGSFLNVCIARWPNEESVVRPRSRCPACAKPIAWYDNIPLLSWALLRARCRHCGAAISAAYPLVELIVASGWLLCAMAYGPTFTAVRLAIFGTVMLGIAVTDARYYLIPDGFTVFGLVWVLVTAVIGGIRGDAGPFAGPGDALIGACTGAGAIAIVGWLGEVALKREAMGFGDVTLMAVIGGALGPERTLLAIFLGAAAGAIVFVLVVYPMMKFRRARGQEQIELGLDAAPQRALPHVPFGVFLAPTAVVALVWGQDLISWYVGQVLQTS
jgi:leader peptidase (prepilin peptidase)/N-methyltransferase